MSHSVPDTPDTFQPPPCYVVRIKPTKAGQRVWFRCDDCGASGDCSGSIAATEYTVGCFAVLHLTRCASPDEKGN